MEDTAVSSVARALWAKSDRDGFPPVGLVEHGRAAGLVARILLGGPLREVGEVLAGDLDLTPREAAELSAALVALHDLGKATPGFQSLWAGGAALVGDAGLPVAPPPVYVPHGFVSAGELAMHLRSAGVPRSVAARLGRAVGAHHGTFPWANLPVADDGNDPDGVWAEARAEVIAAVVREFAPSGLPVPRRAGDAAIAVLAGLTTFADWLASDRAVLGASAAQSISVDAVRTAVHDVPVAEVQTPPECGFQGLFGFPPRGAQVIVDAEVVPAVAGGVPSLVVIEDATGAGKTEAAFQLIHAGLRRGLRGAYVALPTRATANQAHQRFGKFLAESVPGVSEELLLHSSALMTADYQALRAGRHPLSPRQLSAEENGSSSSGRPEEQLGAVRASEWFCRPKRGLLASFAVGTVDQAMLGVLGAKFASLRLLGLTAKTLVLDEVHAYDQYMIAVIERLVSWAGACGCNVVLLSATLPRDMKRRLVAAYAPGAGVSDADAAAYPSVTYASRSGEARVFPVAAASQSRRSVGLGRARMEDPADPGSACIDIVNAAVMAGANVAVVVNTVARAQGVYALLADSVARDRVSLLHSRFRAREREHREQRVLAAFGPDGRRPQGHVVVATQVIEQSLDVDFDLLVSDLAPIDLLLQRIGRLQRHDKRRGTRPAGYDEDACQMVLLEPPAPGGVIAPDLGTSRVYDPHVLLRTALALEGMDAIRIPDDVRELVEAVYGDVGPPGHLPSAVAQAWRDTDRRRRNHEAMLDAQAANRVLSAPGLMQIQTELAQQLDDDDEPAPNGPARTRLGVGCSVVVLRADEDERWGQGDPRDPVVVRGLLERSLVVSHPGLVAQLPRELVPERWRRVAPLSHHRLLQLDSAGCVRAGPAQLRLHDDLGLVIDWMTT